MILDKFCKDEKCIDICPTCKSSTIEERLVNAQFVGAFAKKRLFATSCLPVRLTVCPSAWNNSAPTERVFMKFDIWVFC
jgi:hypothetical protein